MTPPLTVLLRLPDGPLGHGEVVVSAALAMLSHGDDVVFVLPRDGEVSSGEARSIMKICERACPDEILPSISVVPGDKANLVEADVDVALRSEPIHAVSGVVHLVALLGQRGAHSPASGVGSLDMGTPQADAHPHKARNALIRLRRLKRGSGTARPTVAVVAQVQSTWPAVSPVFELLRERGDVDLVVVAVPSEHELAQLPIERFFEDRGIRVVGADWLAAQLADASSPLAAVAFYDPWDTFRPEPCQALTVAEAGVPVVYFPYANSLGVGPGGDQMPFNMPVHQVASAIFVANAAQKQLFAQLCAAGDGSVVATGSAKMDRLAPLRREPAHEGARTFLWNPHFHVGDEGWSTAVELHQPLLDYFGRHPELSLIIRPHFRLVRDFPMLGGEYALTWSRMQKAARRPNVTLDLTADYAEAFAASDALLSDYSSLVAEYLQTDKPVLRLDNGRPVTVNEDANYFVDVPSAGRWEEIEAILNAWAQDTFGAAMQARAARLLHFAEQDGQSARRAADEVLKVVRDLGWTGELVVSS